MAQLPTRRLLVAALAVLALTAGCQSVDESATPSVAGTDAGPATPTAASEPTAGAENGTVPAFLDTHEPTLREAGTVSVVIGSWQNQTATNGSDLPTFTREQTDRLQVNFTSGRALRSSDPLIGGTTVTYRTESGTSFAKAGDDYYRPKQVDVNESTTVLYTNVSALEHRGRSTVDGVTGEVYTLDSKADLGPAAFEAFNGPNISSFESTFVVDERGFASYQRMRITFTHDRATVTRVWTVRTTDVGNTTVEPPAWLDEARAESDTVRAE